MLRFLAYLLLIPFLLALIAFAISNPQTVTLALWPSDVTLDAPLSIAVLVASGVFFFLGAFVVWVPSLNAHARARRAERRATRLEVELAARRPKVPLLTGPQSAR